MAIGTTNTTGGNSSKAGSTGSKTDSSERDLELERSNIIRDLSDGIDGNSERVEENPSNAKEFVINEPPIKKKRGRPPKNSGGTGSDRTDDRSNDKTKKTSKLDKVVLTPDTVLKFSAFYLFVNNTVATAYKSPDFLIAPPEAQAVGEPLAEILNDMGLLGVGLDTPYIRLAMAVAGVYGGRVMIRIQMSKEKQKQNRKSETVIPATVEELMQSNQPTMNFGEDDNA